MKEFERQERLIYQRLTGVQKSYKRGRREPAILVAPRTSLIAGATLTTLRAAVKSAYTLTNVNWVTAGFMVVFHVLAVAAFWFFSWQNLVVALVLHWMAVGFGISLGYHRLHTHRGFKSLEGVRVFPRGLRHADARGRADLLGRHAPPASPAVGPGRRSAFAARRRLLGAHGLDPVRRHPPQQHRAHGPATRPTSAATSSTAG